MRRWRGVPSDEANTRSVRMPAFSRASFCAARCSRSCWCIGAGKGIQRRLDFVLVSLKYHDPPCFLLSHSTERCMVTVERSKSISDHLTAKHSGTCACAEHETKKRPMLVFNSHGAPVRFCARNNADSDQTVSLFACKALNLAGFVLRQFYTASHGFK